jgi:hypothetical protein
MIAETNAYDFCRALEIPAQTPDDIAWPSPLVLLVGLCYNKGPETVRAWDANESYGSSMLSSSCCFSCCARLSSKCFSCSCVNDGMMDRDNPHRRIEEGKCDRACVSAT